MTEVEYQISSTIQIQTYLVILWIILDNTAPGIRWCQTIPPCWQSRWPRCDQLEINVILFSGGHACRLWVVLVWHGLISDCDPYQCGEPGVNDGHRDVRDESPSHDRVVIIGSSWPGPREEGQCWPTPGVWNISEQVARQAGIHSDDHDDLSI